MFISNLCEGLSPYLFSMEKANSTFVFPVNTLTEFPISSPPLDLARLFNMASEAKAAQLC